jgi:hypothetical protein
MTTSDYALATSIASIFIAIGALVWNVWQKFLFVKPTLQITFRISRILESKPEEGMYIPTDLRLLNLAVTNMGPGFAILYTCIIKTKSHWWSKARYAMINPIHGDPTDRNPTSLGPFSAGLPAKIDEADFKSFNFPYDKDCWLKEPVVRVGISDTYQRNVWCRRKDIRRAVKAYRRDFVRNGDQEY